MKVFPGKKQLFFFAIAAIAGLQARAQETVTSKHTAYHNDIVKATFKRIAKGHYGARPLDDAYSVTVWKQFLKTLDPNMHLFLQEDINVLETYKNKIDDELKAGSTTFFDLAYNLYYKRAKEAEAICMKLLSRSFELQKKESTILQKKELEFPANEAARVDVWRKELKYHILRNYTDLEKKSLESSKKSKEANAALETKAREKVRKWYAAVFRKATGKDAISDRFTQYLTAAVMTIDPHTVYVAPRDRSFEMLIAKNFCGIGIELSSSDADYYVKRLTPGGAAEKSGLVKVNDIIVAIADSTGYMHEIAGYEASQVTAMIRGEEGTSVTMKLQQPGENERTISLKREEMNDTQNKVRSALIKKDGKTFGYIFLPIFYVDPKGLGVSGISGDVYREVTKLNEHSVDGIIMDLRGNVGGALDEVVRMCGFFMPAGLVTMLKSKDSVTYYRSTGDLKIFDGPITVLVDEKSASASEIFAAAVQDRQRALVVGTSSTFGKGTAQVSMPMGRIADSAKGIGDTTYGNLRLTISKFYRVSGASTQLRGVVPDIVLQDRMSILSNKEEDYHYVLPYDSIATGSYEKLQYSFDYDRVVKKAGERIKNNSSFQKIANVMRQLKLLQEQPVALSLPDFRNYKSQLNKLTKELEELKKLQQGKYLQLLPAEYLSVNPEMIKQTAAENIQRQEWLDNLKKDIYLNETVTIMEDILVNRK